MTRTPEQQAALQRLDTETALGKIDTEIRKLYNERARYLYRRRHGRLDEQGRQELQKLEDRLDELEIEEVRLLKELSNVP